MVTVETPSSGIDTRLRHKCLRIDRRIQTSHLFPSRISFTYTLTSQGKPDISSLNYYLDKSQPILHIPLHFSYALIQYNISILLRAVSISKGETLVS